jgi:PAS domain S-box-containing protein
MRVLIAEDDLTSRNIITALLEKNGYEVVSAENGAEALQIMLQPDAPHMAILDLMMPEVDGLEVCRRIRALNKDIPVYIIMLTIKGNKDDIITGLDNGANDYLSKPYDPGELRARVDVGRRLVEMEEKLNERVKELFNSHERFRSFVENANDIIYTLKRDGEFSYVSPNWTNMLGHDVDEVEGQSFERFVHPDDIIRSRTFMENAIATGGKHGGIEYRVRHKNGLWHWHTTNASIIYDSNGEFLSFLGVARDITENKKSEKALRESETKYRTILNDITDGYFEIDLMGNLIFCNPAFARMLRYSEAELLTMNNRQVMNAENAKKTFLKFNEVYRTGIPMETFDWEFIRKDGTLMIADSGIHLRYDEQHEKTGFWGLIRDITERKQAGDRIKGLLAEKELILKEVHHRIKNNMNTISSLLALQADTLTDPSAITALADAGSRVQSMMMLYEKLYQTAEFNTISIKNYLPSLVDEIAANFQNCKSVKIEKKIDDFVLDVKKLQPLGIIINELITNIMKYAFKDKADGVITVSALLAGNRVSLIVKDNGCGIPESIDLENSTGFGLQLVHMLAEQLGGRINIERGEGTKFVLNFDI